MQNTKRLITLLIISLGFVIQFSFASTIKIAVFKDHYSTIYPYTLKNACPSIDSFQFDDNQMLAEYIIFCNALKLAGYQETLELVPYPISIRALQAIQKNDVLASSYGVWHNEIEKFKLQGSPNLLSNNQFSKGLYTTQLLRDKLKGKLFEPAKYIAVANQNWQLDWTALSCSGLNLLHVDQYEQMFKILELGRADFVPLTFNAEPDMKRTVFGTSLYPIEGIKISFNDALSFAVNTKTEQGQLLYKALKQGLITLANQGKIEDIYQRLGITNSTVTDWRKLSCN
mgnify:FL=1|jgi:hypothetical protein